MNILLREVLGFKVHLAGTAVLDLAQPANERLEYDDGLHMAGVRLQAGFSDLDLELWVRGQQPTWYSFGAIGYTGRNGLYVPQYMVDKYPDLGFDFWRFFRNPDAIKLFQQKGMKKVAQQPYACDGIPFGCQKGVYTPTFWTPEEDDNFIQIWLIEPDWSSYEFEHMIEGLKLNATAFYAGGNIEALVKEAIAKEAAVVFYYWVPASFIATNNFTRVMFPYDDGGEFAQFQLDPEHSPLTVDEPASSLTKASSYHFTVDFPEITNLIARYQLSDNNMRAILQTMVHNSWNYSQTACDWVKNNEATWSAWIPSPPTPQSTCPPGEGLYNRDGINLCIRCPAGTYNLMPNTTVACTPCPDGAVCVGGDVVNTKAFAYQIDAALLNSATPVFSPCPDPSTCCPAGNCTLTEP
ncbi:hypothetical protein HK101_006563, partial [Irineochytrium annulatum]